MQGKPRIRFLRTWESEAVLSELELGATAGIRIGQKSYQNKDPLL